MALQLDLAEASKFLDLFGEGEPHTFQWFDDTKRSKRAGYQTGQLADLSTALADLNRVHGCGIYFMVNDGDGQGRSEENVTSVRALFVDLDGAPLAPVLSAPVSPHAVVESSPGRFQAYWLVADCPKERFRTLQVAMADRFNGDKSVKDLPRVMRVPGFYHLKKDPFPVRIVQLEATLPYKLDAIISGLALQEQDSEQKANAPLPSLENLAPKSIPPGERHETLLRFAVRHARNGYSRADVLTFVQGINHTYCTEPKPIEEVISLVDFAMKQAGPVVDLSYIVQKPQENHDEQEAVSTPTFALPEALLLSAPGLVGEITAWLCETNFYWQPSYAVAAALSFVGMLKGHNVCTEENSRTNLLTIAVGPSSSGKTVPLKRLQLLAREAGLSHRLCGEPMSEQGLVKGLVESGHKAFVPWDEIGLAFKGMFSSYAPGYKAGIIRLILKLYSMADETVLGFQYANADAKNPRIDLHEPCLCLYGTTTTEGIFGAFSSVEAVNGFAARLLIFETHNLVADRQPVGVVKPNPELVEKVRAMAEEDRSKGEGNLVGVLSNPVARPVPYSPEARQILRTAGRQFEALKNKAILGKRPAEESIWGRAYEQATKVALTVEDSPTITEASARWAVELITALCKNMIVVTREQIADNQTHAELNAVLRLVKEAHPSWVDSTQLCRKTRSLPLKRRKEILTALIEEGSIESKQSTTNGRAKTLFRYVC